ncbi:sensor histidine kinase [Romboutsia weinsteinii]|uniref:histidine kinase n=1 Tax=Romboutsia weinsteinii TaxID=2020949 RepID=A0A371J9G9_9FIRM|nr:sensor histidine kinase [Romboutsia weinsteinii]RDY29401.1 sensor histidine kinase [Romboutsia weinsteinii]
MTITQYLKDKIISILILLLTFTITSAFLYLIDMSIYYIIFINMMFAVGFLLIFLTDFFKRKKFYDNLLKSLNELEEKSYITQLIDKPNFTEGQILYNILKVEGKYINDVTSSYNSKFREYRQYIETWVHEVKTPIAVSTLLIENNKNITTLSIEEEINKIDDYIEQVLYVSKSDTVEKDYLIKKLSLQEIVMNTVRRKSKEIINEGIKPKIHDLDFYILSDSKWVEFIIGQIISNSIKYKGNTPVIEFYSEKINTQVNLYIKDNGMGIPQEDISRVFEKGYIGVNGRKRSSSTGIGLYLCKKLCDKLEVDIKVLPNIEEGTIVKLTFTEAK